MKFLYSALAVTALSNVEALQLEAQIDFGLEEFLESKPSTDSFAAFPKDMSQPEDERS